MSLLHIPITIIASEPAEYQAFTDILGGGNTGALALAGANEKPVAALVCPSGQPEDAGDLPAVILRPQAQEGTQKQRIMGMPARVSDVLEALEFLVNAASGLSAQRSHMGWVLDPARLVLRKPDEGSVTLTDTEARLLACLFDAKGDDVPRDVLLQRVWGYRPGLDTHTPETHIYRLRKKLELDTADPKLIVTTPSGYRFAFPPSP